ncbi:MAG: hypothetical protein OXJ37_00370 [Bryobacterales bacterium]|nr:hypothetical protein [Bryobacterales bacterium]MDE0621590.1 hypothetical protein [Bryobacterales bacterium]
MKHWDSSALVSLLMEEAEAAGRLDLLEGDGSIRPLLPTNRETAQPPRAT